MQVGRIVIPRSLLHFFGFLQFTLNIESVIIGHLTNYGQKANFWTFSIFSHRGNYLSGPPRSHGFG
jgi:hypothetical protein